ncbi:protease [Psychromonas sp. PRT-SC03]|nr:protease [Psychromonas sp. PRT-SC03]
MKQYLQSVKASLFIMLICVLILTINTLLPVHLTQYGIHPRSMTTLSGILFAPFLHVSWLHLSSDFLPFIIFSTLIGFKSVKRFYCVFCIQLVCTGVLVWLFARGNSVHVGMSGIIYAFWGYLIVYGIVRKKIMHLIISVLTLFFYGGLIWGVLPMLQSVSFESHLLGALSGAISGYLFAKHKA